MRECCTESKMAMVGLALLAIVTLLALYSGIAPAPLGENAPSDDFSAVRARKHLEQFAVKPHPPGSPEATEVRQYIFDTLKGFGLDPQIQQEQYVQGGSAGQVHNVVVRIQGEKPDAFMLMGHYDSTPYGWGAADDGAAVASMLETARALTQYKGKMMNSIVFVFTDLEEGGQHGAKMFPNHPWYKDVKLFLNMEARGTRGMSIMFETHKENGWIIEQVAKAGIEPRATSFASEIYRRLPFNSDFTALDRRDLPGMNIAFIDNFAYYHTSLDSPSNISLRSLQHHGTYALGLSKHFAKTDMSNVKAPPLTYFNVTGRLVAYYPMTWTWPIAGFALGAYFLVLILGIARGSLSWKSTIAGFFGFFLAYLSSLIVTFIVFGIIYGPRETITLFSGNITALDDLRRFYDNTLFCCALWGCGLGAGVGVLAFLAKRTQPAGFVAGSLFWWTFLVLLLQKLFPGASYIAAWPLIASAIGLLALMFIPSGRMRLLAWSLLIVPPFILFAPALPPILSTTQIMGTPMLILMPMLLAGLLSPLLASLSRRSRYTLPIILGFVGVLLLVIGLSINQPGPRRPYIGALAYGVDLDTQKAFWITNDPVLNHWQKNFFKEDASYSTLDNFYPGNDRQFLAAPASPAPLRGLHIDVVSDETVNSERVLKLKVTPSVEAAQANLYFKGPAKVDGVEIFGKTAERRKGMWGYEIEPLPDAPFEMTLYVDGPGPLSVRATELIYGLPAVPGFVPRPDDVVCQPNTVRRNTGVASDRMFITKLLSL